jgi:hypothetical protein
MTQIPKNVSQAVKVDAKGNPIKTHGAISVTTTTPTGTNAKPISTEGVVKNTPVPTGKSLSIFEKIKNYLSGKYEEIIEPGIRNKEVEAYRTNDAKEILYKDTIIQDDKNVTFRSKHR